MSLLQSFIAFLGRACVGIIFLVAGVTAILDWQGAEYIFIAKLCDWMTLSMADPARQQLIEKMINASFCLLSGALFCTFVGSLMLLLGITVRLGALFLMIVLVPATLLMHSFWTLAGPEKTTQMALCARNIGILGALLLLLAFGKGKRRKKGVIDE
ncbi:MAG TPA: DoxX family protein, partial [Rhabdochlamydiaceae bacterium]